MRQIVLDTETTGLETRDGHRIIEIGCVELFERRLTGNNYHVYINPQRKVDEGAFKVHGISDEFLSDKPSFEEVQDDFIKFVGNSELIIHNAPFDMGFLNHELRLSRNVAHPLESRCSVFDTLKMARERHPRQKNNLDALCRRYGIDNSKRDLHGALLDAQILAFVYLAMTGGQAEMFNMNDQSSNNAINNQSEANLVAIARTKALNIISATSAELDSHQKFIDMIAKKSGEDNLW